MVPNKILAKGFGAARTTDSKSYEYITKKLVLQPRSNHSIESGIPKATSFSFTNEHLSIFPKKSKATIKKISMKIKMMNFHWKKINHNIKVEETFKT